MASHRKLVLLWAFVVGAVAVPVSKREQCARYCTDESDFSLRPGSTYTYDYETTTVITVQGSSKDKTQVQLTAQADIEVLSKCDLSLRLRGVTLKLSDPESPDYLTSIRGVREFAKAIERKILRFSYQNGKVEHVCPSENVPVWITNIHKGVLSAFQTHMVKPDYASRTIETDVLGKCTAEYHSLGRSWQGTHTIQKLKDLSSCTERENVETYLQGTPYTQDFQTKSLPLMKGSQECTQVIGNRFLQISTCSEKLVFRPFSNGGNGVVTKVTQKLTYAATSERQFTGNDYRPSIEPLLYSHAKPEVSSARIQEEAEFALKELCDASKQDVSITVPRKFSAFIYKLKKLPLTSLNEFYQKTRQICPGDTKARKFFMDAIPLVGTSDSVKFMYDMITRNVISASESNFWLTSLAFITEPTADMISTFIPLLDGRYEQALLGVSALIHTFCRSRECSQVPEVQAAVSKLVDNLGESCYSPEYKKIIMTLKAVSNIGHMFGRDDIFRACYKNPQINTEARLAAIEAFRRISCVVSREDLMRTYSNYNEDSEIRIASYLAVMKCPSPTVVQAVKDVMMKEKINHVGSFIWTHLKALAKSKHPERREIRDIISNLYLLNKYNSDARKFSSAHEATFFLESIDSGLHLDSHLIFSTDSYLPRTAMVNLTVDVFGKTCNLFQIDGRMEGLENVVESFFGPGGYFPQKKVAKLLRERRSVSDNKIEAMDSQFQAKSRFQQQPYGSVDLKIFGTTLWYNQFQQNADGTTDINLLEVVTKLAQEQEQEYAKSFMFLDTTFTVPTTGGFPLRVDVKGTASVGLKIGGKFDVKSFNHVDVLGHIEPSGAIEITSLLTVLAEDVFKSGMRVVSTMHSSTVLDGKVEVRDGEVVKAQLNMPRDRIDIFNMESKLFMVHGLEEREREQTVDKDGTQLKSCTGESTSRILGVKFCSELQLPPYKPNAPLHPVNGPASLNIFIQKTDPTLKSYNFDAQWKTELKNGAYVKNGIISLNTPESRIDRDMKAEFSLNQADHTATLKIKTPLKKIGMMAKLQNENAQKKLDFALSVDDKEYFSLQSELRSLAEKGSLTFTPSLEIRIPSRKLATVTGSAYLKHGQKYTTQLVIEDITEKPIIAKGNVEIGKRDRYDGEFSFSSYALDSTVKGYAQMGDSMSTRMTAEYRILEGKMQKLNVIGKMRNLSANALTKYTGTLNIQASAIPEWNTDISFETMKTTGHIENTVSVALGDGARSRVHTIKMQEIVRYEGSLKNNKLAAELSFSYPEKSINYALNINHENTENSLKNTLMLQYDTHKHINTELQLSMNTENSLSLVGDAKLSYPGRTTGLRAEITQTNSKDYRALMSCQWQEGRRAEAVVHYKDKSDGSSLKYEVEGNMDLPTYSPIIFASTVGYHKGTFSSFAEIKMGVEKYRAKADYTAGVGLNHRLAGQVVMNNDIYGLEALAQNLKNKINCNIDLKMPNRHRVTTKLEGRMGDSYKSGSFEALWDADRDTSKRFVLIGELRRQNDGYDGKATMQIHRRTVKGYISTSLQGNVFSSQWKTNNKVELEWSPTDKVTAVFSNNVMFDRSSQQLNSHFEVITPYYGYENVTVSLTHLYTNQQWDSELSCIVPRGNQVVLSSTGKYSFTRGGATAETTSNVHTSFQGFEEMTLKLFHNHNLREWDDKALIKWARNKQLDLQIAGAKQPSMLRGLIKIRSPFSYFQDVLAQVTHTYTTDNYKTNAEFQWASKRKISVNMEGNHELSGRRRICSLTLDGSSPFKGYENTAAKVIYSNDGSAVSTDIEVTWNRRNKITGSLTGSMRNMMYNKNMESKIHFTSPFRHYENIQISTSLEMNENSYKVNVDTQLPHRSTASLNSQGKVVSLNDIELNAVLIGHFPKYIETQRVSMDFVHKLQKDKLRSTLDAAYGDDRLTVLLIGLAESGYHSRNIEFSATINSPFREYEELKADIAHNQRGSDYLSKIQISKNKMSGSLTHKLNLRDMLNFENVIEMTSTSSVPSLKVSVIQTSNGKQLEHNSYIEWDVNKKIHLNAHYLEKSFLKECSIKLVTPFRRYREIEFKSSYERQDWENKGVISVVWDRRNKVTFSGDLKNYRWESVNAQLEFTSPFKGHEFYSTDIKYDLTNPQKTAEVSFLWDIAERKAITAKGNFLHSYRYTNIEMIVTTPFDDLEQISLSEKYDNSDPEKTISLLYERGWRKIAFNGKSVFRSDGAEISFDFRSPYKAFSDLSGSAKYGKITDGMSSELVARWNRDNDYKVTARYEIRGRGGKARVVINTPFEDFENAVIEAKGNYGGSKMSCDLSANWNEDQKISFSGDLQNRRDGGELTMKIQSPFENYKDMSYRTSYKMLSDVYEGEVKATLNQRNVYHGNVKAKYGGEHLAEIQLNLNSPHSPLRNVQLIASVDCSRIMHQFMATLKWEDKESDVHLLLNMVPNEFYEAKAKLNTPFDDFRRFSFDTSLRNDRYQFLDGRLNIITPFRILPNLDAYGEFKLDDSGCLVVLKVNTPHKKLNVEGKISNRQFRPLTASLEIDAPFLKFRKATASAEVNIVNWRNAKAKLSTNSATFAHAFGVSFLQDSQNLNFEMKVDSSSLRSQTAILLIKSDYSDPNSVETEASMQMFGNVHYITGQYRDTGRDNEIQIGMVSSLLPENKADIITTFSRRRNGKVLEGKFNFIVPSSTHQATAKYEARGNQMSFSGKLDSSLLRFSTLEVEAKYINSNGRDMEAALSVSTPDTTHTIVGNFKNYEGEKYVQMKINCPLVKSMNSFTVTGTLKHEGFEAMDGSLTVATLGKEIRLAGNMKKIGWENIEAFFTVNTPYESLKMLRLDGRFLNDKYQNIDCNFQLETSNENLPSLGLTSKLSRTKGSEEMSLMLRLPLQNYRSVQLLGNVHYNADYSSADSRVTMTLPRNRYVIYSQYGISEKRISGRAEAEYGSSKWTTSGRLERSSEKKDITITITTPRSDTYSFGGAYGYTGRSRHLAATYNSPSNERYNLNTTISYENARNFEVEFKAETPYNKYRNLQGSIQQQYNSNFLSSNLEYSKNGRRGFLRLLHRSQREGVRGTVQIGCPYSNLRDAKLSYIRSTKPSSDESSLELEYNRVKQFKMEVMQFTQQSSHVILDVPVLPLTITADSKRLANGREMNFRSNYYSRIVAFRTSSRREENQYFHDAAFTWDERAEKRISYDFKMADTNTGKELWSRLDTPIRSFMLKGNFTKTSRSSSGGVTFYWDASRSLEKQVTIGGFHADTSNGRQTAHILKFTVEHPKLPQGIVQSNLVSFEPSTIYVKSELHYSRERHHNLIMELTGNDLSKGGRESHYKGEFSLRHPISRLDVRATAELMNSKLESTAHLRLNSMDKRQGQNVRELKAKIFKLRQQVDLMMRSNDDQMSVFGEVAGRNGDIDISLEKKMNEKRDLMTQIRFNRRNKMFDLKITNAENNGVQVSASFPKDSASLKISHTNKENVVTDAQIYLGLEQSTTLKSQLNWRPRLWDELRVNTGEKLRGIFAASTSSYSLLASTMAEEWSDKMSIISRSMSEQLSPFVNDLKNGIFEIANDMRTTLSAFRRMYNENEFLMKDMVAGIEKMKDTAREVYDGLSLGCEVLCNIIREFVEDLYYSAYYSCLDFVEYAQETYSRMAVKSWKAWRSFKHVIRREARTCLIRILQMTEMAVKSIAEWNDQIILKLDKWVRSYAPCIIDGYYYTKNAADRIRYTINGIVSTVSNCVLSNPYYTALKSYAYIIMNPVQVIRDFEYAETAQAFMNRVYDVQVLDTLLNHPNVEYMSGIVNSALRKSVEVYHNSGMDAIVSSAVDNMSTYVKNMAFDTAHEFLSEFYQMKGGAKYDFAPERGRLSLEFNLPVSRNSLLEVFDFKSYPEYKKMMSMKNALATDYYEDFCIWDFYYKFIKYFTPNYWLPSFNAHAVLSGNQHYITFDKLSYEFAGKCSYLLARDFVDGNFSIVVNYGADDHMKKSLTVLTDGRKIDIGQDYKIILDDTKVESPIQIGKTIVIREGPNIRVENEKKGFFMVCNFVHNYCSVSLSGFYFGKTGGLFGTYNYEPELDMMTPTRHLAQDVDSFVNSWEVGQSTCRSAENLATIPGNDYRTQKKCRGLFEKSSSEFRACFKQVNPETYLKMCISDLSAVHESRQDAAICQSAAAYFFECKAEGVPLKMPKHCVRCEKQDGSSMTEGDAVKFTRNANVTAADVVFLIEEKDCNKERVKFIGKLAQGIEDNFRQKGYREVRYSVVGFGGDEVHAMPHVHTIDGHEYGPLRFLESAFQSLKYGNGPINILEALRFAASLNFRPGTTKSFILMKCSTCKSEELKAEYSEMLRTLLDGDITLHLLMEQKYEMKVANKNSKARRVIGVDKKFAYTLKDVKDTRLSGDGDLLAQLKIPKDVCVPLALELSGSSFDSEFLTETKKSTNKKFMEVLARLVVRSSAEVNADWGMCCECIATVDGVGKSACQRCVSAEIANMISADTISINNFAVPITEKKSSPRSRVRKNKERRSGH